jgi:leucine dehydrogenase
MAVQVLEAMARQGFEEVLALQDRRSGLRAFLAIHDTSVGPAFGGIRRFTYRDEKSALLDCLRLALAMSQKCVLAGIRGGGAKVVVLDRPGMDAAQAYRHLGTCIQRLGGRYFAGPDVGTGTAELTWVAEETGFVTRTGPDGPGDLAEATAAGVFAGLASALVHLDGAERWKERTVVLQGLGKVGTGLARRLIERGVRVLASEVDEHRVAGASRELAIDLLEPGSELDVPCDVFSPCAMGGILHDLSIQRLRSRAVCGAANNQLARDRHGSKLQERGILYVPDFVVNSGGVIAGAEFHLSGVRARLEDVEGRVRATTTQILAISRRERRAPARVAVREAQRRLDERRAAARSQPTPTPS